MRKAGTIILAISILFWALMSFPAFPESEKKFYDRERADLLSKAPEEFAPAMRDAGVPDDRLPPEVVKIRNDIRELDAEQAQLSLKYSAAGRIGSKLETITRFAGFDWRTNVALLSGFAAKELIISTLGTAYSLGERKRGKDLPLGKRLAEDPLWNPVKAIALIAFIMLYAPCIATVTCIIRESGAWKWGVFSMVFNTFIAFAVALLIYRFGRLM